MPDQPQRATKLSYRRDVDGLRAVAVVLVVLNHLQTRFSGGYIGVDVFFVISGYLISSVILTEMTAGRFSILGFYERRIRRIFPALLVMMLGASLMAFRYFVPPEVENFGRSMLAALFSVSNFFFWHQAGYFDGPSALKPLLHTWSLAVEEQFYIFFPLFLVVTRRWFPQKLKQAIWTVTLITFFLACLWVRRDATATFFFAPLRAWELLIGTIVSQQYLPAIRGRLQRNAASLAGILLILIPSLFYSAQTSFPGLAAVPPCLGTALLIASGETGSSVVGNILAWRPVVFVGLVSYSFYLWHWPILVFQNTSSMLLNQPQGNKAAKLAIFVVSLAVATLSWRFVETPFRQGRFRPARRQLFFITGIASTVVVAIGIAMISTHGFTSRFSADALRVSQYANYDSAAAYREDVCFIGPKSTFADFRPSTCLQDDPTRKHYLLLGDSHGAELYPGLSTLFPEINFSQANSQGCRLFQANPSPYPDCIRMSKFIYGDYLLHHHVDAVLLAGRWEENDLPELANTIAWIQHRGMEAVVFGPAIEYDAPLPRILATSSRDHDPAALERHRMLVPQALDKKMANLARTQWKARYISAYENLCVSQIEMEAKSQLETASGCPVYAAPGVPLLFDTDHFTAAGSILFARRIRERSQLP